MPGHSRAPRGWGRLQLFNNSSSIKMVSGPIWFPWQHPIPRFGGEEEEEGAALAQEPSCEHWAGAGGSPPPATADSNAWAGSQVIKMCTS